MATARNMAVFIDADNLNDATALDHVLTDLRHRSERVLYKRAYGRVDSLKGIESVLWRHGVRPVSNMIVNKVTTDSALVIDAVEAICTQEIDTVAICSGDADFVPLATWIRERGCHVLCFSLSHKIFANPESFFDEVILLEVVEKPQHLDSPHTTQPKSAAVVGAMTARSAETEAPRSESHVVVADAVDAASPAPKQASTHALVEQVLQALPSLRNGQSQHLSQVVATLRQRGVLGKTTKTSVWFAQLGGCFQLQPVNKPNQIAYVAGAQARKATTVSGKAAAGLTAIPSPETVQRVLNAVPDLRRGPLMLNQVVPLLRQKTILGKTTKSTAFFAQFPSYFTLSPPGQPTQVTYVDPCGPSAARPTPQQRDSTDGKG